MNNPKDFSQSEPILGFDIGSRVGISSLSIGGIPLNNSGCTCTCSSISIGNNTKSFCFGYVGYPIHHSGQSSISIGRIPPSYSGHNLNVSFK